MKTIYVSHAKGRALDWLVAACLPAASGLMNQILARPQSYMYRPSTDGGQGQRIMEEDQIAVQCCYQDGEFSGWMADSKKLNDEEGREQYGPTMLIAAMRCKVAARFGPTAQVPAELAAECGEESLAPAEDEEVATAQPAPRG